MDQPIAPKYATEPIRAIPSAMTRPEVVYENDVMVTILGCLMPGYGHINKNVHRKICSGELQEMHEEKIS